MLGTIVNVLAIILGSLLGLLFRKGIKEKYKNTIMDGIGLSVVIIGVIGAIKTENVILLIASVVIGSFLGELIAIEDKLDNLGENLKKRFSKDDANFTKAFVTSSLLYCVGAMAIVGSLESGLMGNHETLFAKSILDGISAIIFASSLGIGVAFSALPVLLYQGSITLLAGLIQGLLTPGIINEMSAVGSLLILAIGINLLNIKKIKIGNMLPSIFIPLIYYLLLNLLGL